MAVSKETVFSGNNRTDTHINSQILWQHAQILTDLSMIGSPCWWEGNDKSHLYPSSHLQMIPVGKRKVSFLHCSSIEDINYIPVNDTPGEAPVPRSSWPMQNKFKVFLSLLIYFVGFGFVLAFCFIFIGFLFWFLFLWILIFWERGRRREGRRKKGERERKKERERRT